MSNTKDFVFGAGFLSVSTNPIYGEVVVSDGLSQEGVGQPTQEDPNGDKVVLTFLTKESAQVLKNAIDTAAGILPDRYLNILPDLYRELETAERVIELVKSFGAPTLDTEGQTELVEISLKEVKKSKGKMDALAYRRNLVVMAAAALLAVAEFDEFTK